MNELLSEKKIIIYGLSTETERVLIEWNGKYNVVGLLDGFMTEGEQFGYRILDINEVVRMDNIAIIVVARPGSCKVITKRIGALCREHNVPLFDIRGNDLLEEKKVVYDFKAVSGYTKQELLRAIDESEAVSFDLFDTLLVRNVSSLDDLLSIIDIRLRDKNINITDFVNIRTRAEKKLSIGRAPRLDKIYGEVLNSTNELNADAEELSIIEYAVDLDTIEARREMVTLVNEIIEMGKPVYITSDCYYSKTQLQEILKVIGVDKVTDIIVSCEYDTSKTGNLFEKLIAIAGTKNIIHIGDDTVADEESAKRHGIKAFRIYSAIELLELIGGLNLLYNDQSLSDRIRIGMFTANLFNSPFQFEDDSKYINVNSPFDIGYLFAAPMVMDFTRWFEEKTIELGIENRWLCARDGFLLRRLYEVMYPDVRVEYFYTSRISAIRAGMDSFEDIEHVDSMKFTGEVEDNLRTRFGIDIACISGDDIDEDESGLLKYVKPIIQNSIVKRENNKKYINSLNVKDGDISLFDFVAKGTSQLYIQKLVNNHIKGLYFMQLEPQFMKDMNLDIIPFYKEEEREKSVIFENYYILETLLTSPEASVDEFDDNGTPVFAIETRSERDIDCVMKAQNGIVEYTKKFLQLCPTSAININKKLDEQFLMLLRHVAINDIDFLRLTVEDPFFNRMTDITDVL